MKIVISSGHSLKVRGAAGPEPWGLDEVDEARKVTERVAAVLRGRGHDVKTFHDDTSTSQSQNLNTITAFHNKQVRDLDCSIHFNAYEVTTTKEMGAEVLYASNAGMEVAEDVVDKLCAATGFTNRGPKHRGDLAFLNNTTATAVLVETCFCDTPSQTLKSITINGRKRVRPSLLDSAAKRSRSRSSRPSPWSRRRSSGPSPSRQSRDRDRRRICRYSRRQASGAC